MQLKRILGAPTAWFIGMGVAIGSGVFRTPGEIAADLREPWWIISVWVFAGLFVLAAGLVTAELATRFSEAGGEYVFLREAYGEFVAFFFGWAYTVFIVGGGAATIAAAFGDFASDWLDIDASWSGALAALAIIFTTTINALGLRTGARAQNILTCVKIVALLAVIIACFAPGSINVPASAATGGTEFTPEAPRFGSLLKFLTPAIIAALWAYDGTTDSVKMAEEIKDVRRALPRALIGSALSLMFLYLLFNLALLRMVPVDEMAGMAFVPGEAMARAVGPAGRNVMLCVAMIVCLGSLSSTVLATVRVTFALARDGLTFRFMSRMSANQAPVPALIVVACVALVLVLMRGFGQILSIYFFASNILFGLSYASLIVFRRREAEFPKTVFRCPAGPVLVCILILVQLALAVNIAVESPQDAAATAGLLVIFGALYFVWKRFNHGNDGSQ